MAESNFYVDIKKNIETYFGFLKDFGFSDFEERQLAFEMHFEAKKNDITIDIWIEAIVCTPIWAKINDYYIVHLERDNENLKAYNSVLKETYDEDFDQYLKDNNCDYFDYANAKYQTVGKTFNENYIKELSEIIRRNPTVLEGNFSLLKSNRDILMKEAELALSQDRINRGIFTLEYYIFPDSEDLVAYEEFETINDMKIYLQNNKEIKIHKIYDCYENEVNLYDL